MKDPSRLLVAYDEQLRTESETFGAVSVARHGPLRLATFDGGRGFVTYGSLDRGDERAIRKLVPQALDFFRGDPTTSRVEWKTRGHDQAPGLHEALLESGFTPGQPESIMRGDWARVTAEQPAGGVARCVCGAA